MHFSNRTQAGKLLAEQLRAYAHCKNVIVLALPRGGVPVGLAVAKALDLPLDILLVRKLGVPGHEEYAMGAVTSSGLCVLQPDVLRDLEIPMQVIKAIARRKLREVIQREKLYRAGKPALDTRDKIVVLVDDGVATGSTMLAAIRVLRKTRPARIIVAVPVAAPDTVQSLQSEVDDVICLQTPEPFYSIGLWYENFEQTTDEEVQLMLAESHRMLTQSRTAQVANVQAKNA